MDVPLIKPIALSTSVTGRSRVMSQASFGGPWQIHTSLMTQFKSDFLRILQERGFIHQCSDPEALDEAAVKDVITAYIGFDCTATSLHAGSLLPIMILYWLQQTGHRPIARRHPPRSS